MTIVVSHYIKKYISLVNYLALKTFPFFSSPFGAHFTSFIKLSANKPEFTVMVSNTIFAEFQTCLVSRGRIISGWWVL